MYLQSEEFQLCELRFVGTVDTQMQIQTHMPHIDNNAVQTLGCFEDAWRHNGHVRAWPHSFFMFVSEWGSFYAALPHWKWKSVICVVRFSFTIVMRGQLLTRVVIMLHVCQGIPSLFWNEQKTVLTLRARGIEDASTMLHAGCFTI